MFYISNYQWMTMPSSKTPVSFNALDLVRKNLDKPRSVAIPTIAYPSLQYGMGLPANWGLVRHAAIYRRYFETNGEPEPKSKPEEIAAVRRFYGADERTQRIFFTRRLDHSSPGEFLKDADELASGSNNSFVVRYYDGDRLQLSVTTSEPCWLTFVDNWDPNWTARIGGQAIPVELALGSYKAVRLAAGHSELTFEYRPPLVFWRRNPGERK
jgi:hypothetical protein